MKKIPISEIILSLACAAALIFSFFPPVTAEPSAEKGEHELKDMAGQTFFLKGRAEKVSIFPPVLWHWLTLDESSGAVFSMASYLKEDARETLLGRLYPDAFSKRIAVTRIGAVPVGVEQTLYDRPDAVMTWEWFGNEFAGSNYKGIVRITSPDDGGRKLYALFADMTGKHDRYQRILSRYDEKMAELHASVPEKTDKVPLVIIRADSMTMWGAKFGRFNNEILTLNAYNAAVKTAKYNGASNLETLITLNPEIILLAQYGSIKDPSSIYANRALSSIDAVRNRRVYAIPAGASRMEGPVEEPILYRWLNVIINGAGASGFRDEIKNTYKDIYGYTISDDEIDAMLNIKENTVSYGYEVFGRN